jgi:hypothetical protein
MQVGFDVTPLVRARQQVERLVGDLQAGRSGPRSPDGKLLPPEQVPSMRVLTHLCRDGRAVVVESRQVLVRDERGEPKAILARLGVFI